MKKNFLFLILFFSTISFGQTRDFSENSYDRIFDRDPYYELEDYGISQTFSPKGRRCGTGSTGQLVPDMPFGFDFTSSCSGHDNCYSVCKRPKSYCDGIFRNDMKNYCKGRFSGLDPRRPACLTTAQTYWQIVKKNGGDAYQRAQSEACSRRH